MSCGTCHVNGAGNGKLYVPGMSTRPGNFDTSGPLFNPSAHNRARDPVRVPNHQKPAHAVGIMVALLLELLLADGRN